MTRYIRVSSNGVPRRVKPAITPSGGSGPPTVFVAASDASTKSLQTAAGMGAFGFVCTGANDEVELQAAVDVVNGLGFGRVQLSEGTFTLANEVELYGVNLVGVGMGETTLSAAAGFAGTALLVNEVGSGYSPSIADLTLNGASNAPRCYFQTLAVSGNHHFHQVEAMNATGHGIVINRSGADLVMSGCHAHNNGGAGVYAAECASYLHDCDLVDNGTFGFYTAYGVDVRQFVACRVTGNGSVGISSESGAAGAVSASLIVVGCAITGNTGRGVDWYSAGLGGAATITGNRITGNGTAAIRVAVDSLIVGNVLDAAPSVGSGCTVAHNEGVGSGDHSDLDLADLGSGAAADDTVLTADGAGGAAFEPIPRPYTHSLLLMGA